MRVKVVRFEPTPNPHAVKCWLDAVVSDAPASFRSEGEGRDHPIAARLFEAGATSVLLCRDWVTVNKPPAVSWTIMRGRIRAALDVEAPPSPGDSA